MIHEQNKDGYKVLVTDIAVLVPEKTLQENKEKAELREARNDWKKSALEKIVEDAPPAVTTDKRSAELRAYRDYGAVAPPYNDAKKSIDTVAEAGKVVAYTGNETPETRLMLMSSSAGAAVGKVYPSSAVGSGGAACKAIAKSEGVDAKNVVYVTTKKDDAVSAVKAGTGKVHVIDLKAKESGLTRDGYYVTNDVAALKGDFKVRDALQIVYRGGEPDTIGSDKKDFAWGANEPRPQWYNVAGNYIDRRGVKIGVETKPDVFTGEHRKAA